MKIHFATALLPLLAWAQERPAFDVASIKPSPVAASKKGDSYLNYGPQGLEAFSYTLRALIVEAYQSPSDHLIVQDSRANEFLDRAYDVIAKAEHPAQKSELQLMLQRLLEDRFKLVLRLEDKIEPIYRLTVSKQGPKLRRSSAETPNPRPLRRPGTLELREATIPQFCQWLTKTLGRRVVDATRIEGIYDFKLTIDEPSPAAAAPGGDGTGKVRSDYLSASIFSDIRQLGLQLAADKGPLEHLVVDHLEPLSEN